MKRLDSIFYKKKIFVNNNIINSSSSYSYGYSRSNTISPNIIMQLTSCQCISLATLAAADTPDPGCRATSFCSTSIRFWQRWQSCAKRSS